MSTKSLSAALAEPFDEDQIGKVTKKGKRFSNVAPVHYVERLVHNHPLGYDVIEGSPTQIGQSIVVPVEVKLYDGDQVRVSRASGASPLNDENGNALDAGDVVKSAASDGLKRALMKFGLGTHLYHEEAESVGDESAAPKKPTLKPASKPTPQVQDEDEDEEDAPPPKRKVANSKPAGNWESKREKFTYPMGKNKGTSYADLEANFLTWAEENLDPDDAKFGKKNAEILKCVQDEIKYRKDNGEWAPAKKKFGNNKPTRKRSIGDDSEDSEDF